MVLEKAYGRVMREEVWYCMRKSGMVEKYVRVVQNMYEGSVTVVKCAVGVTDGFKVELGLHEGSGLRIRSEPFHVCNGGGQVVGHGQGGVPMDYEVHR